MLRLVIASAWVIRDLACLLDATDRPVMYIAGFAGALLAGLLSVGFLTPVAAIAGGVASILTALNLLPKCFFSLCDCHFGLVFGEAILLALAVLGPGAYSLDARLFGRREIIIPRAKSRDI